MAEQNFQSNNCSLNFFFRFYALGIVTISVVDDIILRVSYLVFFIQNHVAQSRFLLKEVRAALILALVIQDEATVVGQNSWENPLESFLLLQDSVLLENRHSVLHKSALHLNRWNILAQSIVISQPTIIEVEVLTGDRLAGTGVEVWKLLLKQLYTLVVPLN